MSFRVIGIDPGYDRLGVAVIERSTTGNEEVLFSDCITTPQTTPAERLCIISDTLRSVITSYTPHVMGIESLFFNTNQKTAIRVAEARGVILLEAGFRQIPVYEYTPSQIKSAITGNGRSSKKQIQTMIPLLVSIQKKIHYDDEYDALATALTCIASTHHLPDHT